MTSECINELKKKPRKVKERTFLLLLFIFLINPQKFNEEKKDEEKGYYVAR